MISGDEASPLPDPAVVVLVGAAGSGKSTWAAEHYRPAEIVSSDALRDVVGSGPADLEASVDAFDLLDRIVAARSARRLTVVVDTLGLERQRRVGYLRQAQAAGLPAVLVVLDTPAQLCRARNAARDRPVPADVLRRQLATVSALDVSGEGWDRIVTVSSSERAPTGPSVAAPADRPPNTGRPQLLLQLSSFGWGERPGPWLREMAAKASEIGLHGIALMDHLIQIPQVGRAWDPIPEPWVSLGFLAGAGTTLRVGTLVSPVTFRAPGIVAKVSATLSALAGGPTFLGLGAGWWQREHEAYGLDFPSPAQRLDQLETCIETLRAMWAPGTKSFAGPRVRLPETTCYPRPAQPIPIIVGGSGERRTLRIVAEQADGCNLPADEHLPSRLEVLRGHAQRADRPLEELEITVLDLPLIGRDRDDVARRVERWRGRTPAAAYAARHHAGTPAQHAERYLALTEVGVDTVFLAPPGLDQPDDLELLAPLVERLR